MNGTKCLTLDGGLPAWIAIVINGMALLSFEMLFMLFSQFALLHVNCLSCGLLFSLLFAFQKRKAGTK